jgi:pyruvoyl-dependent arginine decarboxylase (PvlArgDC)
MCVRDTVEPMQVFFCIEKKQITNQRGRRAEESVRVCARRSTTIGCSINKRHPQKSETYKNEKRKATVQAAEEEAKTSSTNSHISQEKTNKRTKQTNKQTKKKKKTNNNKQPKKKKKKNIPGN